MNVKVRSARGSVLLAFFAWSVIILSSMDKLTLDTNVMRDWAWCKGYGTEVRYQNNPEMRTRLAGLFGRLEELRDAGECEVGITTQLHTDYDGTLSPHIEQMIGPYVVIATPALFTFPLVFPFVGSDPRVVRDIFKAIFPHSKPEHARHKNNLKDVLQLYAHKAAQRDYFLTSDHTILSKRGVLAGRWSIKVQSLQEYVDARPRATASKD